MENSINRLKVGLCVVGGAGSGLTAALRAADCGVKDVLVIEKNKNLGGCTRVTAGFFAVDSPYQKSLGEKIDVDAAFKDHMRISSWHCNAKLVRNWYLGSGEMTRWLMDMGLRFDLLIGQSPLRRTGHHSVGGGNGLVEFLIANGKKRGVSYMTDMRADGLMTDDNGAVCGVRATRGDGQVFEISCENVILATGSISRSEELMARYYPQAPKGIKIMSGWPHNTGDGHLMVESIGGRIGDMFHLLCIGPHNYTDFGTPDKGCNIRVGHLMRQSMAIYLNQNGYRFVDENVSEDDNFGWMRSFALETQPGHVCFPLMDVNVLNHIVRDEGAAPFFLQSMARKVQGFGNITVPGVAANEPESPEETAELLLKTLNEDMDAEAKRGKVKKCDTLDEVAEFIGCDPETLKKTVADYNACCAAGYDNEFLKERGKLIPLTTAPYYIFRGEQAYDTCLGGITIDHEFHVMDKDYHPIKGLFAVGTCTSGWANNGYGPPGTCLGSGMFGGYTVGKLLAPEV